ncbi:MAG: hypothetical protein M3Z33_01955 [Actinomycetota bacterium]|nr:hypothetical protein [Actinomycetota bacterium]
MGSATPLDPTGHPRPVPPARDRASWLWPLLGLLAWVGLIAAGRLLVEPLYHADFRLHVGNPPLVGRLHVDTSWALTPAVLLGIAAVIFGPALADRLSWRKLLVLVGVVAFAWAIALAASDGLHAVIKPIISRYEYLHDVPLVDRTDFLGSFTALAPLYTFHVHAHPPLMLIVFWAMSKIGLGGGWAAALAVIGMGAMVAPAALVAVRELAGEARARVAAPFLALAPAALWIATSPDGFYAGVAAIGIAGFAVAASRSGDARGDAYAFASGIILGAALFLSYGITALGAVVVAIAAYRRALRPLLFAAAGVACVALGFLAAGFSWYDGLQAARELQLAGVYELRPYAEFLVASPAAFALVVGPAAAVGLARMRDRGVWVLTGAALLGLCFADLSGYARGETERVWLQFAPWVLVATVAVSRTIRGRQAWLALQVGTAIVLQVAAKSPW